MSVNHPSKQWIIFPGTLGELQPLVCGRLEIIIDREQAEQCILVSDRYDETGNNAQPRTSRDLGPDFAGILHAVRGSYTYKGVSFDGWYGPPFRVVAEHPYR